MSTIKFSIEPSDIVVPEGNSVLLPCAGIAQTENLRDGKITPNIRWRGPDGQDIGIVGDTFRAQLPNGSLYISSVEDHHALTGPYQCLLNVEGIGTIVSRSARVSIAKHPETNHIFSEVYLFPGQTAYVKCLTSPIQHGIKYKIEWLKDEAPLHIDESRMTVLPSGAIEIDELTPSDRGTYQCNVTSGITSRLSSKTNLNIKANGDPQTFQPPSFLTESSSQTVREGDTVTMDCVSNGNPKPSMKWLRNGEDIDINDLDSRFRIIGTGSLQITSVDETHAGNYQCRASNSVDSLDMQSSLQVQVPPKFVQSPSDKIAAEKEELELVCAIRGKPTPIIQWLKNGDVITPNDYMQIVGGHNLRILGLINSDAGMFQCVGSNPAGSVQAAARLHIIEPDGTKGMKATLPGPPRDLVAQIVNPRFVALSWMEPLKNPDEVTSYTVYYKMTTSERERKITTKSRDDQLANIQSLLPGKTYQFRVVGNSNFGAGESSAIYEVSTQPEENISGPPQDIDGFAISHKELHIQWTPPLIANGNISKYRIYYSMDDGSEMYTDSTSLEVVLSELRPFTEYTVSVVPFNQNGMGDPSNELVLKTFSAVPTEPPTNVTLEATSSTSITMRWEPPPEEEQNGPITGYKIRYRKQKQKTVQVATSPANARRYELTDLDRMGAYQVKIAAMTINGTGPFTEWYHVETYENDLIETHVPGEPSFLRTRPSADSIFVNWGPPSEQEVRVRGYILSWGLGIPDVDSQVLDETVRAYEIKNLEPNSEYVISLRARNSMGDGKPRYENVRTRDDETYEIPVTLEVPVGLRAITMSANSIVVYWTDTTLSRSQQVVDNRHYVVRYNTVGSNKFRFYNTSDLNCMISDLRHSTQYEFAVKVVKGRRESAWSMSVLNSTSSALAVSSPRDLTISVDENNPQNLILRWLPPKHSTGQINGYIVFYTTDDTKRDRDWNVEAVVGDILFATIKNLKPYTKYYFKVQTRSVKGSTGPFSTMITYATGPIVGMKEGLAVGAISTELLIYLAIGIVAVMFLIVIAVVVYMCRRKPPVTPEHAKQSYHKNNAGVKPPDLWIHHDQMELKNVEKNHTNSTPGYSDGASSSGAMTLPRSVNHEFDNDNPSSHITNSLDKRSYIPGYMTTSMNSTMERPQYPRTQYNMNSRAHVSMDPNLSQQNLLQSGGSLSQTPDLPYNYDSMPSNYSNPSVTYAPGLSVDAPKRGHQGHPLKSFSVPGPPSTTPLISNTKHTVPAVTIRPQNASPYKKPAIPNVLTNRLQSGPSVAHSNDEIQRLAPSVSIEDVDVKQEMANLEEMMKDLHTMRANEFEC
ncbi:Neogenin [Pseudolycoriella hygida]|uniref:Neogenin n=1 Tax=Pseudolycoriella hygida TaxID=35572 RepID=A0A9Q0N5A6_9DIPT|nr:Neogenin [Pseudolycoriella hygida]